jgi:molybdopterin synthase sulfur carrier subunit
MKVLYFARIRQIVGRAADDITLPAEVATVAQLVEYLAARDAACEAAFADRRTLRAAVDRRQAAFDSKVTGASEVAFFPPVTGG